MFNNVQIIFLPIKTYILMLLAISSIAAFGGGATNFIYLKGRLDAETSAASIEEKNIPSISEKPDLVPLNLSPLPPTSPNQTEKSIQPQLNTDQLPGSQFSNRNRFIPPLNGRDIVENNKSLMHLPIAQRPCQGLMIGKTLRVVCPSKDKVDTLTLDSKTANDLERILEGEILFLDKKDNSK